MASATDKLSEGQKACLRLVTLGYEAKEIARELQLNPHTVVERLRAARRTLGAATSKEAARMLAAQEGTDYNRIVTKPNGVVDRGTAELPPEVSIGLGSAQGRGAGHVLRENQASYRFPDDLTDSVFPWPLPSARRRRNDLGVWQTLVAIVGLTLGLTVAALGAIAIVDQLSRLQTG